MKQEGIIVMPPKAVLDTTKAPAETYNEIQEWGKGK